MPEPCVIYVANRGFALAGSRLPLIKTFLARNWKVIIATADDRYASLLGEEGAEIEKVHFARGGMDPRADAAAYSRLKTLYAACRPRLIHHFNAKPLILGSLAARNLSKQGTSVVNTITGLGHAFGRNGLNRWIAGLGYRLALPSSTATIFQNPDDRELFLKQGWVDESHARLIVGSGVDINRFRPASGKDHRNPVTALMVARLLWQKGVNEYIQAARQVKLRFPESRFQLAGEFDAQHPDAITEEDLAKMNVDGAVEFLGYLPEIESALMAADIFVYPSYYREGVPRVVLEASACALPTVAADVAGTREAVSQGETGWLVAPGHVDALAERISTLVVNAGLREQMGLRAREMAEDRFDINSIVEEQLQVYRDTGVDIRG